MIVMASSHSKAELETNDVVFVQPVALKSIHYDSRLLNSLKICETEMHL